MIAAARAFVAASAPPSNSAVTAAASGNAPGSSPMLTVQFIRCQLTTSASMPGAGLAPRKMDSADRSCALSIAWETPEVGRITGSEDVNVPVHVTSTKGSADAVSPVALPRFTKARSPPLDVTRPAWVTLIRPRVFCSSLSVASMATLLTALNSTPCRTSTSTEPFS